MGRGCPQALGLQQQPRGMGVPPKPPSPSARLFASKTAAAEGSPCCGRGLHGPRFDCPAILARPPAEGQQAAAPLAERRRARAGIQSAASGNRDPAALSSKTVFQNHLWARAIGAVAVRPFRAPPPIGNRFPRAIMSSAFDAVERRRRHHISSLDNPHWRLVRFARRHLCPSQTKRQTQNAHPLFFPLTPPASTTPSRRGPTSGLGACWSAWPA